MKLNYAFVAALAAFLSINSAGGAAAFGLVVNQSTPSCVSGRSYYASIQEAIDDAGSGDTVVVCPGVYAEVIDIFKSLSIYSYAGAGSTVIAPPQGSAQYAIIITAPNTSISGFKIEHKSSKEKLASNAGVYVKGGSTKISNSVIETSGPLSYGLLLNTSINSAIENSAIKTDGSGSIGIYLSESAEARILNSSISTSGGYAHAIYIYSSADSSVSYNKISTAGDNAYGTALYSSKGAAIANNMIATTGQNAFGIYYEGGESSEILKNNITTQGSWGMGIYFRPASNSKVSENSITTSGAYGWGIVLAWSSSNSSISENFVKTSGIYGYGIYLFSRSNFNRIHDNTIETNITGENSWALKVDVSSDNVFINNVIAGENQKINHSFTHYGSIMLREAAPEEKQNSAGYADMDKYLSISFSGPGWMHLNISYNEEEANFIDEAALGIFKQVNKTFERVKSEVNKEKKYVYGNFSEDGVFALLGNASAKKSAEIAVFSNSVERAGAENLFSFLKTRGIEAGVFNASEFEREKSRKILIILGGPDAPEGIGELVRSLANRSEQEYFRVKGNKKMLALSSKSGEQRIFIIAGSDRHETAKSMAENKYALLAALKNAL